ncbi:MAG TPA: hypothetical protein VMW89_16520 [Desulfatiglandales bacterium]|nr:hypothetical protein [Desulfatiglandales bacterium]
MLSLDRSSLFKDIAKTAATEKPFGKSRPIFQTSRIKPPTTGGEQVRASAACGFV